MIETNMLPFQLVRLTTNQVDSTTTMTTTTTMRPPKCMLQIREAVPQSTVARLSSGGSSPNRCSK